MDASLRGHRLKSAPRHSKTGPSGRAYFGPSEPAHHRRRAAQKAKHPNCSCSQEMRTRFSARRSVCYLRLEAACSQEVNRWSDPMVPKGTSFHTSIQPRPRAPLGDDRVNVLCFKPRLKRDPSDHSNQPLCYIHPIHLCACCDLRTLLTTNVVKCIACLE